MNPQIDAQFYTLCATRMTCFMRPRFLQQQGITFGVY